MKKIVYFLMFFVSAAMAQEMQDQKQCLILFYDSGSLLHITHNSNPETDEITRTFPLINEAADLVRAYYDTSITMEDLGRHGDVLYEAYKMGIDMIDNKIWRHVAIIAKERSASLVLDRFKSYPPYADLSCDITQEIADRINAESGEGEQ